MLKHAGLACSSGKRRWARSGSQEPCYEGHQAEHDDEHPVPQIDGLHTETGFVEEFDHSVALGVVARLPRTIISRRRGRRGAIVVVVMVVTWLLGHDWVEGRYPKQNGEAAR